MNLSPLELGSSPFVVVDKPALMLSTPPRFFDDRPIAGRILESQLNCRLWPVHRLDFEVSGLLVFAKTAEAHREANIQFERQLVKKTYQAVTLKGEGVPSEPVVWTRILLRGKKRSYESPHGQLAKTRAQVLRETNSGALIWQLEPLTGKPHQLRVELSLRGMPILGDELYGSTNHFWAPGIGLRAIKLEFSTEFCEKFALPPVFEVNSLEVKSLTEQEVEQAVE